MQLSAANLLLAAQQAARQAQHASAKPFASVPSQADGKDNDFTPLEFRQTAPASGPAPASATPPRPGTQVDIRI